MKRFILMMLISSNAMAFGSLNFGGFNLKTTKVPNHTPSWVQDILHGGGAKVQSGSLTLVRNVSYGKLNKQDLCNESKQGAVVILKDMLPYVERVPVSLEHTFYGDGYCAITISIKTKILKMLQELSLSQMIKELKGEDNE